MALRDIFQYLHQEDFFRTFVKLGKFFITFFDEIHVFVRYLSRKLFLLFVLRENVSRLAFGLTNESPTTINVLNPMR